MISQKYIDLMNQELDGVNTPEQTRELESHLQANTAARDHFRELALALNLFDKVAMVDPPPELAGRILTGARHGPEPAAPESAGWRGAWDRLSQRRPGLAHSLTFAAGLACGLLLLAGSSWLDARHGTELNGQVLGTAQSRAWDPEKVTEGHWMDTAVEGRFRTQAEGGSLLLLLEVSANRPVTVRIDHGPQTSLGHYGTDNPVPAQLAVTETRVEMKLQGRGSYDLEFHGFDKSTNRISMTVHTEGRLVYTEELTREK